VLTLAEQARPPQADGDESGAARPQLICCDEGPADARIIVVAADALDRALERWMGQPSVRWSATTGGKQPTHGESLPALRSPESTDGATAIDEAERNMT
jgi:hypothetical protein